MLHAPLASILINILINVCLVPVPVGYALATIIVVCAMLDIGYKIMEEHVCNVGGSVIIVGLGVYVCSVMLVIM